MSTDCSLLTEMSVKGNFANFRNEHNSTLDTIWLTEDFNTPFNQRYWTSEFLFVFIIYTLCSLLLAIIFYFYFYPKYDIHKRLTFYVETKGVTPSFRADIKKLFHIYTNQSDNIIKLILDYGEFECLDEFCTSSFNKKKVVCYSFKLYLIILITYSVMFHITIHWVDSYRSYIEVPCVITLIPSLRNNCEQFEDNDFKQQMGKQCVYEFNLQNMCNPNTINLNNYIIYGDLERDLSRKNADQIPENGFRIHKKEFKFRQPSTDECCSDCGRIHRFCNKDQCFRACSTNGCIYILCFIFVIVPSALILWMMASGRGLFDHDFGYQIHGFWKWDIEM
eukprot:526027_1